MRCVISVALIALLVEPAAGGLIAYWDFNDSDVVVDQGAGTLTHGFPVADTRFFSGSTVNALPGVAAGEALVFENQANNGRSIDLAVDTTGLTDIQLSFATRRTSTGFNDNQTSYSVNGGSSFMDFGGPWNPPTSSVFGLQQFDLSAITALNNNPNVVLRLTLDGAVSAAGNNRLDNIQINGAAQVPEPSGLLLMVLVAGPAMLVLRAAAVHRAISRL